MDPMDTIYNIVGWTETPVHEHEFYAVQFSYAGWVECACGYKPPYEEWSKL